MSDDKDAYLHPYWYPSAVGEDNEVLPALKNNVTRRSFKTLLVDVIVSGLLYTVPLMILAAVIKRYLSAFDMTHSVFDEENRAVLLLGLGVLSLVAFALVYYIAKRPRPVYLVDFMTSKMDDALKMTMPETKQIIVRSGLFTKEYIDWQSRLLDLTGLGHETYLPRPFHIDPMVTTLASSREECEIVIRCACDRLFANAHIDPTKDIDVVICNCSLFNPTPSISAMLMNMYKIKDTCKNYNLSGMGCSAGLFSIDLAKDLLQVYPNINVLVFSTENITQNWYDGKEKGMLLSNTLFRMGGAAILLSNKSSYRNKARFQLLKTVRVHHGKFDDAYNCVFQKQDPVGKVGVKIGRDLLHCVTRALMENMGKLMPSFMSYSDYARAALFYAKPYIRKLKRFISPPPKKPVVIEEQPESTPPTKQEDQKAVEKKKPKESFVPNFREIFQAFCIHAGGRGIIDGLQKNMGLTDEDCMPSRATLYRVGNTSSSSIWYETMFIERTEILKPGDKVWQVAFGSGLKCNSVVWKKLN